MGDDQTPVVGDLRDQIIRAIGGHFQAEEILPFDWSRLVSAYGDTADRVLAAVVAPLLAEHDQGARWRLDSAERQRAQAVQERDEARAEVEELEEAGLTAKAVGDSYGNALTSILDVLGIHPDAITEVEEIPTAVRAEVERLRTELAEHRDHTREVAAPPPVMAADCAGMSAYKQEWAAVADPTPNPTDGPCNRRDCKLGTCGGWREDHGLCGGCCSCLAGCLWYGPDDAPAAQSAASADLRDQIARAIHSRRNPWEAASIVVGEVVAPLLAERDRQLEGCYTDLNSQQRELEDGKRAHAIVLNLQDVRVERLRRERDEARTEVERLRAELAEALTVAERAARDTGARHTLDDVVSDLNGTTSRDEVVIVMGPDPDAMHLADKAIRCCTKCGGLLVVVGRTPCPVTDRKPRRREEIDARGLYTERTDPAGA